MREIVACDARWISTLSSVWTFANHGSLRDYEVIQHTLQVTVGISSIHLKKRFSEL